MTRPIRLAVLLLLAAAPARLGAQARAVGSERIVAVVGDEVVLLSELEEQTVIAASQAGIAESDTAAVDRLRKDVLQQMVNDLVVVAAARSDDSISVSTNDVNEAVEAELNEIRSRFPSPSDFEQELGRSQWRTLDNYKRNLRRLKERELLAQAFLQKNAARIPTPVVTDEEVREYFDQNRERLGNKPPTVKIRELNLVVQPTEPARARAHALADSLMAEVRHGASFADLAKQFSADKQSAQKGGDLGYFKRGVMVKPFEEAVFAMDSIGQLAGPIETDFGFHIVRLEDRQGDEVKARHILVTPEVSDADRAATRAVGEALVDSLHGGADFDSLAARHSASSGGRLEPLEGPLTQLPPEWQDALRDLPVGGTTGLLTTPAGFAIVELQDRTEGGAYTFEELAPRIRSQLQQTKGQDALVEELRKQVYVDVRWTEGGIRAAEVPVAGPPEAAGALRQGPAEPPPVGAPAVDSLPAVKGPPEVGSAKQAYTPGPEDDVAAPNLPQNPAPLADTHLPDSLANAPLPPGGERVTPSGAVDSLPAGAGRPDSTSNR